MTLSVCSTFTSRACHAICGCCWKRGLYRFDLTGSTATIRCARNRSVSWKPGWRATRNCGTRDSRGLAKHSRNERRRNRMANKTTQPPQAVIRLERRYEAAVEDLWFLWTTKEGFESWWGPEGFRVEVRKLDLREGGELVYDMIAATPEHIEFMKKANMPVSHGTRGTYV